MSSTKVMQRGIGLIGVRSTPTMIESGGMYLEATWSQPPGAAQRSITHLDLSKKLNFLSS